MSYEEVDGEYKTESEGIFGFFKSRRDIKPEFQDYYKTDIIPRLETPEKHIVDEAIHWLDADWDRDLDIVFWTEGVWPGYTGIGSNQHIYVVEMENGAPINLVKKKMGSIFQDGYGRYKESMFFKYPNQYCGFNDFVRGMFTYFHLGASASSIYRYMITYDKYEQRIKIREESSSVFLIPKGCEKPKPKKIVIYADPMFKSERRILNGKDNYIETWWYESGQKSYETTYKNGKENGLQISWHENGKKEYERNYKEGVLEGHYVRWYEDGIKEAEGEYINGSLKILYYDGDDKQLHE